MAERKIIERPARLTSSPCKPSLSQRGSRTQAGRPACRRRPRRMAGQTEEIQRAKCCGGGHVERCPRTKLCLRSPPSPRQLHQDERSRPRISISLIRKPGTGNPRLKPANSGAATASAIAATIGRSTATRTTTAPITAAIATAPRRPRPHSQPGARAPLWRELPSALPDDRAHCSPPASARLAN